MRTERRKILMKATRVRSTLGVLFQALRDPSTTNRDETGSKKADIAESEKDAERQRKLNKLRRRSGAPLSCASSTPEPTASAYDLQCLHTSYSARSGSSRPISGQGLKFAKGYLTPNNEQLKNRTDLQDRMDYLPQEDLPAYTDIGGGVRAEERGCLYFSSC